jgi:hypothetical protein
VDRYGLFGSNTAHVCDLCRTMEHGIGSGSTAPGCQERPAEGVMVRRLSVASLDSGAQSSVYGEEPSAVADRVGQEARPPCSGGGGNGSLAEPGVPPYAANGGPVLPGEPAWQLASSVAPLPSRQQASSDARTRSELTSRLRFGGFTSHVAPPGGSTRDITVTVEWLPAQASAGVPRLAGNYDMSVVARQSGRWYLKDIRASHAADGSRMTWYASSWAVPRGSRSPRKLTDVHGREG